jgi:GAF domain-containing protein
VTVHPQPTRFVEIVALLRELTAQLIASPDLDQALDHLTKTAAGLIDGSAWCGVTLVRAGAPTTAAASDDLPARLDQAQYRDGDGPCLLAIRTREMVLIDDLVTERRWPAWRRRAIADGVYAVLSVPIDVDDHIVGALNLYAGRTGAFPADIELVAMLVAEHAALLLAAVLDRSRLAGLTEELRSALGDGGTVNRAIGIVMAQRGCSAEDALEVLRQAATRLHQPLTSVAERLVETISQRSA